MNALSAGASDARSIAKATGLSVDVVSAGLEHLRATGVLTEQSLTLGCPDGGCTGCGTPTGTGCSTGPADRRGPVLLTLSVPPSA